MIILTRNTEGNVYFTGSENAVLSNPLFLFIFTHRTTRQEVRLITFKFPTTTKRYDTIYIEVDADFGNVDDGFFTYDVYETTINNQNQSITGLNKVETGLMYLKPSTQYEPTKYEEQSNEFKTYGQ